MRVAEQIKKTSEVFLKAAQEGNTFLFNTLIEPLSTQIKIGEIVDAEYGGNALHWASNNGHLEIVKPLVEKFPTLLDSLTANNSTSVLNAISEDHEEIVRYLAQQGANLLIENKNHKNAFSV